MARWQVEFHPAFEAEFAAMAEAVQDELLAQVGRLAAFGPTLGRPAVDSIQGSTIANLKELRFDADGGVWRVLFAFDKRRAAILLASGDKRGANQQRFYRSLIRTAEARWLG